MPQLTTTLNRIRTHSPCRSGWTKLLDGLDKTQADDEPLVFSRIAEINGLDDVLWCCQCEPQFHKTWRLFAIWCARQVEHLMTDQRSKDALNVAERYANDLATSGELYAAWDAAWDAVLDATQTAGARAGIWEWDAASYTASDTALNTALNTKWAAWDAAWAIVRNTPNAARDGRRDATWDAVRETQLTKFIEMTNEGE